jgi:oligoendopeptidase F
LQLYRNFKNDEPKTLAEYKAGLSLGYAKPLPEVWRAMGIDFDFSPEKIRELMEFVQSELATLE